MRVLGAYAVRQEWSLANLARKVDCSALALRQFFESKNPRLETIGRVAAALGFATMVSRALHAPLDKRDAYALTQAVMQAVRQRGALFADPYATQAALLGALDDAPTENRYAALAAFEFARTGLIEPVDAGALLAPELFALATTLGVNLGERIASEARARARELDRCAARAWALEAFPLSDADHATVESIFAKHIAQSARAPLHALAAAQTAYRRLVNEPETLAGALAGFTPKPKGKTKK